MGNAALTIHVPSSLVLGDPVLEGGKVVHNKPNEVRFEKSSGAATGCGGRVQIRKKSNEEDEYSELYAYVSYNCANNGEYRWNKNDLGLKFHARWVGDSELIIDVTKGP
eukprot:GFUD01012349.1.p1 GENE.GFUD01012349.1~~GFUD01012349.1.p1  ORF type:complete len:109 (+),score=21.42 GFUD01012349.1:100-426(+)